MLLKISPCDKGSQSLADPVRDQYKKALCLRPEREGDILINNWKATYTKS